MPKNIVILTGAGLSAESGLSTFRDPNGIWARYDWRDVATPQGFAKDPGRVHEFYNMRRRIHSDLKPNTAHLALTQLEKLCAANVTIVTQNVDALHEAAGSQNPIHMHGEMFKALCMACSARFSWATDMGTSTACPVCAHVGQLRPDVVWFGETPYHMDRIVPLLAACDLFISIGTSGNVYPAAAFVAQARSSGARTIELNLEPSTGASLFDEAVYGPATRVVPAFVTKLMGGET